LLQSSKPDAANPAMTLWLTIGDPRHQVADQERSNLAPDCRHPRSREMLAGMFVFACTWLFRLLVMSAIRPMPKLAHCDAGVFITGEVPR